MPFPTVLPWCHQLGSQCLKPLQKYFHYISKDNLVPCQIPARSWQIQIATDAVACLVEGGSAARGTGCCRCGHIDPNSKPFALKVDCFLPRMFCAQNIIPVSLLGVYRTSALMSLIQRLWPANHSDVTLPNSLTVLRSYEASWLTVCLLHLEQKLHNHRDLSCLVLSLLYPKSLEQSKYDTEKLSNKYSLK